MNDNGILEWLMKDRGMDPAMRQGILAAGLGIMANQPSGASELPQQGGLLQSIGQGGLQGINTYQNALYNQSMIKAREAQMAEAEQSMKYMQHQAALAQREQDQKFLEDARIQAYISSLPAEEQQQALILGRDYIKYKMESSKGGSTEIDPLLERMGIPKDSPEAKAYYGRSLELKTSRAPPMQTTIHLPPAQTKYDETFGGEIAKMDIAKMKAAEDAPGLAEKANQLRAALDTGKVITGFGAEQRLLFSKAGRAAGLKVDPEVLANTETVWRGLADQALQQISGSGLGTGQGFTSTDLKYLERARSGTLEMEEESLVRVTELAHRAAAKSVEMWNKRKAERGRSATSTIGVTGVTMDQSSQIPGLRPMTKPGLDNPEPTGKPQWRIENGKPVRVKPSTIK